MESESVIRLGSFLAIFSIMAIWELAAARRRLSANKMKRWGANLGIVALNGLLVRWLIPAGAVGIAVQYEWGMLHRVELVWWQEVVIAVVLLDLAIYLQHVIVHKVPLFWRFHRVHHADRDIDVTTGLRFHPVEILFSMLLKMGVVFLIGAPALAVIVFEVILNGMAMFNHSNVRLPKWLDSLLRLIVVTPDFHRVHHSIIRQETDSNYGFNLSIWDRIFGSYRPQPEKGHAGMQIGLAEYQRSPTWQIGWMLRLPFRAKMGE